MRRIGIIGGSYNPIHDGHVHIMEEAYERIGLDEVWMWISHNIFKDPSAYAPLHLRTEMCAERTVGRPWLKAQDFESVFHDTRTASSMATLQEMFPATNFVWIFGDDNFAGFHTWNDKRFEIDGLQVSDWQYIMRNFAIAVMRRAGYEAASHEGIAAHYGEALRRSEPKSLSNPGAGWSYVDNTSGEYSSTGIKEALQAGHSSVPGLSFAAHKLIADNGLYGLPNLPGEFQTAALPHAVNNEVRLQTFLLLANTLNLVKTLAAHEAPGEAAYDDFKTHFAACWDKSNDKGDFEKLKDVPGELADCLISLSWIADLQGQKLALRGLGEETPSSVSAWCEAHFPGRGLKARLMDYIEELAELCVCEGLEKHRAQKIMDLVFDAPDLADPVAAFRSNLERLQDYAMSIGGDIGLMLDEKMKVNRGRSAVQSAEREGRKRETIQLYGREP